MADQPRSYYRGILQSYMEFLAYLSESDPQGRAAMRDLVDRALKRQWTEEEFRARIEQSIQYTNWYDSVGPGGLLPEPEPGEEPGEEETPEPAPGTPEEDIDEDEDVRLLLEKFLVENELPLGLMAFITDALSQGWSYDRILYELRKTPEYKATYPENDLRLAAGFTWMPESQIREYRSEARRLAREYFGYEATNAEIADLLVRDKSLVEWERNIQDYFEMQKYGPAVNMAFEAVLGYQLDEQRLWEFFSRDIPTPELEAAYQKAWMMGQPAVLGLGMRPEEEADILRSYGINPEEAFRGYQQIAAELPRATRLSAIDAELARQGDRFPSEMTVSWNDLFKAAQLHDMESLLKLAQQQARELARWRAGGGPSGGGQGLLAPEER